MEEPDLAHFQSIPWCATLISNPAYTITPTFSRHPKPSTEDSLIAETLSSPTTISHCLSLYLTPSPSPSPSPSTSPSSSPFITEILTLLTLGTGMNGGPGALHGGLISTLLDDCMGTLLTINKDGTGAPLTGSTVTASLDVRFLRRVETPGTVCVRAKCVRREGRKFALEAWVEDGGGVVLARGKAVWVRIGGGSL